MTHKEFLDRAVDQATKAGHVWPEFAACEAALESAWGESQLAKHYRNLFGQKQGKKVPLPYPTVSLPTKEFLGGEWRTIMAEWVVFPDWATSFRERMALLRRLAPRIPAYAAALAATSGEEFIHEVSRSWATDPKRADKVLAIYRKEFADGDPPSP